MKKKFVTSIKLKIFIAKSGERFSQLYQEGEHFPMFYPSAYCTRKLRNYSSPLTQIEHLYAIKKLYQWENKENISIEERIFKGIFFSQTEYDKLIDYIAINGTNKSKNKSTKKLNSQIAHIAEYLEWLSCELITDTHKNNIKNNIDDMKTQIIARKYKNESKSKKDQETLDKKISNEARMVLLNLFEANQTHQQNTFQFRNTLMMRILYETGMRVGELLNTKLDEFEEGHGGDPAALTIIRNNNNKSDDRKLEPTPKTRDRKIPISHNLSICLQFYIKNIRQKTNNVGHKGNDFIFVNQRRGERQGKALEYSSFYAAICNLTKKHAPLNRLHPHIFRHDWNYRFSKKCTELGISETKENAIREYQMGWVEDSPTVKIYNKRHVQEMVNNIGNHMNEDFKTLLSSKEKK